MGKRLPHLVLVGGGHSHVQVIRNLSEEAKRNAKCYLLSDAETAVYSGMIPAAVAGVCAEEDALVHLRPLCRKYGWDFIRGSVVSINSKKKDLRIDIAAAGEPQILCTIPFDVLSIDVGSRTRSICSSDPPVVSSPRMPAGLKALGYPMSIKTRPIGQLVAAIQRFEDVVLPKVPFTPSQDVVVVGGGAAGLELALALDSRLRRNIGDIRMTIVSKTDPMSAQFGKAMGNAVRAELRKRKVQQIIGKSAVAVKREAGALVLEDGSELRFDLLVMATGAAAHKWLSSGTDLTVDEEGWVIVEPTLLCRGCSNIFATGDCASFDSRFGKDFPPKAGVYAVRQGPVLTHNIEVLLSQTADDSIGLKDYIPQSSFLSLISTGDGRGIGSKYGLAFKGTWVYRLKSHIDESWQEQFRVRPSNEVAHQKAANDSYGVFSGTPIEGAAVLQGAEDIFPGDAFEEQLRVLRRMDADPEFRKLVIERAQSGA